MQVTTIQSGDLDRAQQTARQAAEAMASGGLVVFPTETVYGIAASVASDRGMQALQRFKQRADSQPFTVHLPDSAAAERYIDAPGPMLRRLIGKAFPGPVTLVVDVPDEVIADRLEALKLPDSARSRLYHNNTVGLRCPDHPLAQQILAAAGDPVVASSANRRGQDPPHDAQEAAKAVADDAELIVDGGRCRYAKPSTIVRVRGDGAAPTITVEREGVYDERFIRKLMRWTMLLVCSGNTCRSPMGAALARSMLAEQRGITEDELEAAGLRVVSAGAYAAVGMPASQEAAEAMQKLGLDLACHRSQVLSPELIHEADVIYCMTENHRHAVVAMVPAAADKVMPLDPNADVNDPIGSDATAYQRCAELIRRRLAQRIKEQQP
ncbi:MAG: L-threonylcarbamoyladenylate synthase [Phycisphaeraceae bacterium]